MNGFCADARTYHVQTVDFALVAMFKYTCGLEFYPDFGYDSVTTAGHGTLGLCCLSNHASCCSSRRNTFCVVCPDSNTPFGDVIIISLGFVIVFVGTLPMAYFNLDDNIWVQIGTGPTPRPASSCHTTPPPHCSDDGETVFAGACVIMMVIVLGVWMVDFFMVGLNLDQLDVIGDNQRLLSCCPPVCGP